MNGDLDQDTAWLERIGAKTPGAETEAADVAEDAADDEAEEVAGADAEAAADDDAVDDETDGDDDDADDGADDHDDDDHEDDQDEQDHNDEDDPASYDLDDYNYRYSEDPSVDDAALDDADPLEPLGFTRFSAHSPAADFDVEPEEPEPVNRRFTPWVLGGAVAAVAIAALTTTVLANVNTAEPSPPTLTPSSVTSRPTPVAPPPAPPPVSDETGDGPIPFTATSDCNSAGSTPAQSVAIPDSPTPWICVIEGPGQVLSIQLGPPGVPQSYVITGISIIPGAVGKPGRPPTEPDPWLQHHVVTRIQFGFNDPANTVLPSLNTGNVRGEVPMPVPRLVASRITAIIQETSRPPAPQPTSAETPDNGGVFGGILGPAPASTPAPSLPGADTPGQSDISDRTFAITSIKIIGHRANQ